MQRVRAIQGPHAMPNIQEWQGEQLQVREQLLVISEQGLGDTIHFMRYIPLLRQRGVDVAFCAQTKLHSLIKASNIDDSPLTPEQANLVTEGKWIPLLSLPRHLDVSPQNVIIAKPYVSATDSLINKWKKILSKESRPIIAINWQGNPSMEKTYQGRSIPLEIFSILFKQNDIKLLSLQKGFGTEQLDNCSFKEQFVDCQKEVDAIWDFLEMAAIIMNCDLIITSDTSVAHLAGALGKKTWLLLHHVPDWRWGVKDKKTFWYPSMKLFRQTSRNEWKGMMEQVAIQLEGFFTNHLE